MCHGRPLLRCRLPLGELHLGASGQAAAISAGHRIRALRPDLTSIPLHGVDPAHVVLATRTDDRSRLVAAFRRYAQANLTGPADA